MMEGRRKNWTTEDEKKFIDVLGTLGDPRGNNPERTLKLLKQYRAVLVKRKDWGTVSRIAVFSHVDDKIKDIENG